MLYKRLALTTILAVALAAPSIVMAAEATKSTSSKSTATQTTKPANTTTKTTQPATTPDGTPKATQEANLAKFKNKPDDTVIAVVNGEKITKGELLDVMWNWTAPLVLDEYINYKIALQTMKKEGITVTRDEAIERLKANAPSGEPLEVIFQRMHQAMDGAIARTETSIGLEKVVAKQSKLTDAEYAGFIKARHILVMAMPGNPNTSGDAEQIDQAAKEKIEKILAEIRNGKPFDVAAQEYSDDPGSKQRGGELGWFRSIDMVPEFSEAAFKLKAGEVSEPVKSPYGYHIIKVDRLGKDATPAEKKEIEARALGQGGALLAKMKKLFSDLRQNATIINYISPEIPANDQQGPGLSQIPSGPQPPANAKLQEMPSNRRVVPGTSEADRIKPPADLAVK